MQSSVTIAQSLKSYQNYIPRVDTDSSPQQRRRASSSRGCEGEEKAQLTIIAPEEIALTASTHPTFWINLSEVPSHTVRVSISHPKESEPIYEKDLTIEKAGFQRIDIPTSRPKLRSGETYILTVGILCNPLRLSESVYARVVFKKVDLTAQTKQKLVLATNDTQKAAIFASEGIGMMR
ncbi:MAG: DUF928 domain-containing protein [Hydrococcus sp. RM1_1_31]|nr:DUF928 domain-containing protein [Hydrococcus sp. RM1_1_31]